MITVDEIRRRIADQIENTDVSDDRAHEAEDTLWRDVLKAIVGGASNAAELAAEALKSQEITFNRWYS